MKIWPHGVDFRCQWDRPVGSRGRPWKGFPSEGFPLRRASPQKGSPQEGLPLRRHPPKKGSSPSCGVCRRKTCRVCRGQSCCVCRRQSWCVCRRETCGLPRDPNVMDETAVARLCGPWNWDLLAGHRFLFCRHTSFVFCRHNSFVVCKLDRFLFCRLRRIGRTPSSGNPS